MLLDNDNEPVKPVLHYLKFKDNSGASRYTLRSFSYHLKLFFEFLEQKNKDYRDIGIDEMADFMRWLQNPHQDVKVSPIFPKQPIRKARTVNIIINTVVGFYDYLMRHEDYSIQLSERLKQQVSGSRKGFKIRSNLRIKTLYYFTDFSDCVNGVSARRIQVDHNLLKIVIGKL